MSEDQMRLRLEQGEPSLCDKALDKLEVAVELLNSAKQTMSNVDGRGLSIAITHIETGMLWIKDAAREAD
jgi:hypothetical protein